jgi:GntR family transcriptional repressor for pyruvate dehydrogenase complex
MDDTPQAPIPRRKLSDQVAAQIKEWLMTARLRPGDRLPQERDLMARFGVGKGTIREALKALEVQGLVRVATGPGGGAVISEVHYKTAAALLGNYFYFQGLDTDAIYEIRRLIEPEMAASVVGHLTAKDFVRLEQLIERCSGEPEEVEDRRRQRLDELEFHNVLARRCPNPLLSFQCRFINKLLADVVVIRQMYVPKQKRISQENHEAHFELLAAYRKSDRDAVRQIMAQHMEQCSGHVAHLKAVVEARFLTEEPATITLERSK